MKVWPAVLFVLAIAMGASAAPAGQLAAGTVTFNSSVLAEGSLGHLETDDRQAEDSGLPLQHFFLVGGHVSVEIDWSASDVGVAGNRIAPEAIDTDEVSYDAVDLGATRLGSLSYVFISSLSNQEPPRVTMETQRATVSPPAEQPAAVQWVASDRAAVTGSDYGVAMTTRDGTYIVVEGSFLVSLWDVDLRIEHEQGTDTLWTGERNQETGPAPRRGDTPPAGLHARDGRPAGAAHP